MTKKNENIDVEAEVIMDAEFAGGNMPIGQMQVASRPSGAITPMVLIEKAMTTDAGVDQLTKLWELQVAYEKHEAEKAFNEAFAAFKSEAISIVKDKQVGFDTNQGRTEYSHASLFNVVNTVTPFLSKYNLALNWDIDQDDQIKVTAILSHAKGHSKTVSMKAGKDDSGKKNAIQQIASTKSYLERYTALAVLGLAAKDQDDDGRGSEAAEVDVINEEQWAELDTLLSQLDEKKVDQFMTYFKVTDLAMLPMVDFDRAKKKLSVTIEKGAK